MATVQYALCSAAKENKVKAVSTGVMRALVELMVVLGVGVEDLGWSMVYLVSVVVAMVEGRAELVKKPLYYKTMYTSPLLLIDI